MKISKLGGLYIFYVLGFSGKIHRNPDLKDFKRVPIDFYMTKAQYKWIFNPDPDWSLIWIRIMMPLVVSLRLVQSSY